ncbi:ATP-binding protein [Kribbella sp. NBC_00359]|uniref:ATP-binding protein n=1 Tax=Kribbella sp. NBC_00359 TaxID=2975966 RepID=UPI002E1F5140
MNKHVMSATMETLDVGYAKAFRGSVLPADWSAVIPELGLDPAVVTQSRLEGALGAALTHDSYLYEHHAEAPHLTPGVLKALEILGSSWLSRELTLSFYARRNYDKAGGLSAAVAFARTNVGQWSASIGWLRGAGLFGRSIAPAKLPERIATRVLLQLLGMLCLLGEEEKVHGFAASFVDRIFESASATVLDPVTLAPQMASKSGLTVDWHYESKGPDHSKWFAARLVDSRGRRADGDGPAKKTARAAAAERYLRQYYPQALTLGRPSAPEPPRSVPVEAPREHRRILDEVIAGFELDSSRLPLLSQAFMHPSWTYENTRGVQASAQRDNLLLGFVGSKVLEYEFALSVAQKAIKSPPETLSFNSTRNDVYAKALLEMGLGPGLLLGAGQRSSISVDIAATAFQAAMAAVFLAKNTRASLLNHWPSQWEAAVALIAPARPRPADPSTKLQELSTAAGLIREFEVDKTGPDHDSRCQATLTINSSRLRRRLRVKGQPDRSKTGARHRAAMLVVDAAEHLADGSEAYADRSRNQVITKFLAAHLATTASGSPDKARIWIKRRLFGAHLAARPQEMLLWAEAVDTLLDAQTRALLDPNGLEQYFVNAMTGDKSSQGGLRSELVQALDWLAELENPGDIDTAYMGRVVQLAGAYRAAGIDGGDGELREFLLAEWPMLYRDRITVHGDVPGLCLSAGELAVLDGLAKALTQDRRSINVHVANGSITFNPVQIPIMQARFLVRVWGEVSPRIRLQSGADALECVLPRRGLAERGPVREAVERALVPVPAPLSAAIANLLHDLKNELTAARQAAMTTGGGRTAELRRMADASEHLDQAKALAQRIRANSSLLRTPDDDAVALAEFLRDYAARALRRVPAHVAIVPPRTADEVNVGLDESSLRAVLDNLVKNAVEAMPGGGTVTFDWTHDGRQAVLEVADDGPGLPDGIAEALADGRRVNTSKSGGNGLGLLGVQALLRRIGGSLEAAPSQQGTRWHATVPLAQEVVEDDRDESDPA